jgi:hypothetical protein
MKYTPPRTHAKSGSGSMGMQLLVAAAILLVLVALGVPIYSFLRGNAMKADTLSRMNKLSTAARNYAAQNDGALPKEDASGTDTWEAAANPASASAWYNALPKLVGAKSVGDYASTRREFYHSSNLLFVPGADYPIKRQLARPYFGIAINTKLQRKNADGRKTDLKLSDIVNPARTVLFMEQGLPGEARSMAQQTKKDYDGASKGSPKSFVARYRGKGWLLFVDGHAQARAANEVMTEVGTIPFPPGSDDVIWSRNPEEDPNK